VVLVVVGEGVQGLAGVAVVRGAVHDREGCRVEFGQATDRGRGVGGQTGRAEHVLGLGRCVGEIASCEGGPSPTRSGSARGARPVLDQHHREIIVELVGGVFEDGTHQPAQRFGGWQVGQQVPGQQVG
jgi:hypothetical protein